MAVGETSLTIEEANGHKTVDISIKVEKIMEDSMVALSETSYTYTGNSQTPTVTVTDGTKTLAEGTDYTLSYVNSTTNSNDTTTVGTITITVTGIGNYTETATTTYTINRAQEAIAEGDTTTISYNGSSQSGISGSNITWSTSKGTRSSTDAGEYTAYATPADNYAWSDNNGTEERAIAWKINPKQISTTWGTTTTFTYNGSAQAPTASAESGVTNETLNITRTTKTDAGTYTGTNASTASITSVTGGRAKTSNYTLTNKTKDFTINAKSVAVTWTDPTSGYTYKTDSSGNGVAQGPEITVTSGVAGETISVSGTNLTATNAGSYTATVTNWSVTGGQANKDNYTLTNKTHDYTIARAKSSTSTASGGEHTYTGSTVNALSGNYITWRGDISGIDAGDYTAYATPTANYQWSDGGTEERKVTWKITPKSVSVTWGTTTTFTYNGNPQAPTASATSGITGETLNIERTTQTNAGTYTGTNASTASITSVTGGRANKNNYALTNTTKNFTINRAEITTVPSQNTTGTNARTYNGNAQSPVWNNYDSNKMTIGGTYQNQTNAGSYDATFTPTANYKWSDNTTTAKTVSWTIGAKSISGSDITITLGQATYTYDGNAKSPTVTVKDTTRNTNLILNTDYTLSYKNSSTNTDNKINAGTITVTVTGKGNYLTSTTKTTTYTINRAEITTVPSQNTTGTNARTYNGNAQSPVWNNYDSNKMTIGGTYQNQTNAGSYDATFTPTANYKWSDNTTTAKTVSWTIGAKSISGSDITITLGATSYTYDGNTKNPSVTVKDTTRNTNLTLNTDYTLSYKNSSTNTDNKINAGTITVTVTGKGNYLTSTTKTTTYTISKAKPNITLSATSGSVIYNSENTFTAKPVSTPAINGTWTVSSNSTNVTITQGNNATATNNTASTIKYKGAAATTTGATITVTFTPSGTNAANYDTAKATYSVTQVSKRTPSFSINPTTLTITEGDAGTIAITYDGDGTLGASSNATGVATASVSNKTVTVTGVSAGSATITVTAAAGNNYIAGTNKTCAVTVESAAPTVIVETKDTAPWLPAGATVTNSNLSTGVTMKDKKNNEWTWVVVPKSVTASVASIGASGTPTGSALEEALKAYAAEVVTNRGNYKDEWYSEAQSGMTSAQYTAKKRSMLNSIKEHGGFWIGKYEVGSSYIRKSANRGATDTPLIQQDKYPYTYVTCAEAEDLAETLINDMATTSDKKGSLLFGTQWDLTLAYLVKSGAITQAQATSNSTDWGNYRNKLLTINSSKAYGSTNPTDNSPTWTSITKGSNSKADTSTAILLTTGAAVDTTGKLNIVDLAGNVGEWTLEYTSPTSSPCVIRGYHGFGEGNLYPASHRYHYSTATRSSSYGFRATLF